MLGGADAGHRRTVALGVVRERCRRPARVDDDVPAVAFGEGRELAGEPVYGREQFDHFEPREAGGVERARDDRGFVALEADGRAEGRLAGRQVVGGRRKLGVLDWHQPIERRRRAVAVRADVLAGGHAGEPALTELVHGEVVQVGRRVRGVDRLEVVRGHVAGHAIVDQADAGIAAPAGLHQLVEPRRGRGTHGRDHDHLTVRAGDLRRLDRAHEQVGGVLVEEPALIDHHQVGLLAVQTVAGRGERAHVRAERFEADRGLAGTALAVHDVLPRRRQGERVDQLGDLITRRLPPLGRVPDASLHAQEHPVQHHHPHQVGLPRLPRNGDHHERIEDTAVGVGLTDAPSGLHLPRHQRPAERARGLLDAGTEAVAATPWCQESRGRHRQPESVRAGRRARRGRLRCRCRATLGSCAARAALRSCPA